MDRQLEFKIMGFPLPPTVNRLYAHVHGRTIKTKVYREYERAAQTWIVKNSETVKAARTFVRSLEPYVFHVETEFMMSHKDIICINGKPKRNDTSNRLKALHDVLSQLIGVDDCYFWSGTFGKIAVPSRSEECVNITLRLRLINNKEGAA